MSGASRWWLLIPERLARKVCLVSENGRLGLRLTDGSIVDPLIGEPYASQVREAVAAAIRAAMATLEACADEPCNACIACLRRALDNVPEWHERKVAEARRAALDEAAATVEGCDREAKRWQIADAIRALSS